MSKTKEERYFVDRDESGDYYCIPVEMEEEWEKWQYSDGETDLPEGCFYIGGHANRITFTNPEM